MKAIKVTVQDGTLIAIMTHAIEALIPEEGYGTRISLIGQETNWYKVQESIEDILAQIEAK